MPSKNAEGISKVACTSRHAPVSDKSRTAHGSCAFLPRIIVPDLSMRLRGAFRWLAIGFRRSDLLTRQSVIGCTSQNQAQRKIEQLDRLSCHPDELRWWRRTILEGRVSQPSRLAATCNQVRAMYKKSPPLLFTASSFRPGHPFRPECSTVICRSHGMLPFAPPFNAECPGLVPRRTGAPPTKGSPAVTQRAGPQCGNRWSPVC